MNPKLKYFSRETGLTLIEVMIALAIFSLIGLVTVKQISQISQTKKLAFEKLDSVNVIRTAITTMRFDISQAFHVRFDDLASENKISISQGGQAARTLFDGRKSELVFTSLSHRNYYANRRECEQTEISYFLFRENTKSSQSLMKRESELIDSDLYEGGKINLLVENVETLLFKYWDEKTEKWVDQWNSDNGQYKDKFPQAIQITIAAKGADKQILTITTNFKIAFPNNEELIAKW